MAGTYKTPNVYVEEITKLPPSVAEVDTAVPAFVGYTEIAKRYVDDDLHNIPTRIKNLLEYEQFFGAGPSYSQIHVQLDVQSLVDKSTTTVANSIYNLYESLRLFFDNGGGVCYICSVGKYSNGDNDATRATNLSNGLDELRKFDEPTILLFPDAVTIKNGTAIDWDKIAGIQQKALTQCGDLGDRFAVLDVPDEGNKTVEEEADTFRSKIGMNNLKYGAAYMPFVKTIYDKNFALSDIMKNLFDSGSNPLELKSLFSDADKDAQGIPIKQKLDDFKKIYTDNDAINARLALFSGATINDVFDSTILDSTYQGHLNDFNGAANDTDRLGALKSAFEFVFACFAQLEGLVQDHSADSPATIDSSNNPGFTTGAPIRTSLITNSSLDTSLEGLLGTNLKTTLQTFADLDDEAYRSTQDISGTPADQPNINFNLYANTAWKPANGSDTGLINGADLTAKGGTAFFQLNKIFQTVKAGLNSAITIGNSFETANANALIADLPVYNSIISVLNSIVNTLPPSGAVAGIYATVDRNRGVWKAPANVSINSVSDVSELITDSTQEGLNVDSTAGKSINAIRAFYGKGILVWGARTLAGNDNEWRYVPVRRFFSFVEESCKKSTSWCVFEPNDANTWARIRGQIDNFLNNQWRLGALAGAKPEQAYYVNCGLGTTMTSQDILNGYLYVEIGMAAVRPAEFVVLRFSHMLQQS
ncbi:MAG: phage tail sheath subtilisin-like domain-containing protein [Bacteroidetes bacterium]|nr:phage tail sheath subtilisin-like domain-containing protein [Bacteroidota bacterium]